MEIKEKIKDIIYREQVAFSNEIYDNEDLTQEQCGLLDNIIENFCNKLELLIEEEIEV